MRFLLLLSVLFLISCDIEEYDKDYYYVNEDFTLKEKLPNNEFLIERNANPNELTILSEKTVPTKWDRIQTSLSLKQIGANVHFDFINKKRFHLIPEEHRDLKRTSIPLTNLDSLNIVIKNLSNQFEELKKELEEIKNKHNY